MGARDFSLGGGGEAAEVHLDYFDDFLCCSL